MIIFENGFVSEEKMREEGWEQTHFLDVNFVGEGDGSELNLK